MRRVERGSYGQRFTYDWSIGILKSENALVRRVGEGVECILGKGQSLWRIVPYCMTYEPNLVE